MFYARRRRRKLSPDRIEAWVTSYEKEVPALLGMPGFMGTYLLADRASGDGESYSFWESREALESTRSSTDALGSQQKVEIGLDTVSIENFEVIARTGDKVHTGATHARVREWSGTPDQLEVGIPLIKEKSIPALGQDLGFLGGFWLGDRSNGKSVSVLLYDSKASLEAAEERQAESASQMSQVIGGTEGERRYYEIIARTVAAARTTS